MTAKKKNPNKAYRYKAPPALVGGVFPGPYKVRLRGHIRLSQCCPERGRRLYLTATHVRQFCPMLKDDRSFPRR